MTLATDIIPKSRMSEGIGYLGLTRTIAGAFPPILALEFKDAYGYQTTFTFTLVIALVTLLSGFTLNLGKKIILVSETVTDNVSGTSAGKSYSPSKRSSTGFVWEKMVDKDAMKSSTVMLFFMFSNTWVGTFLVAYAVSKGIGNPGVFFTANAIATGVARLFVGKLSQKFGSVAALAPGILLTVLSMFGMYSSANLITLIISGILYGAGMGMVQPELNSLAVLAARDDRRGLANSTFFMAMDLGTAMGAYIMGVVASYAGLGSIFLLGALFNAITFFCYLLFARKGFFRTFSLQEAK